MPTDTTSGPPDVNIALLRGINVGGKNRLPMKDLAAMFVDAGCDGVRTYIQSGNIVFRSRPDACRRRSFPHQCLDPETDSVIRFPW